MRSNTCIIHALGKSRFYFSYFCWGIVALQCSLVSAARQSESCVCTCVPPVDPRPTHPLGHQGAPGRAPCGSWGSRLPGAGCFTQGRTDVSFSLPVHPTPLPAPVSTCLSPHLGLCSHLQIGSSVPFFQILHTCTNI